MYTRNTSIPFGLLPFGTSPSMLRATRTSFQLWYNPWMYVYVYVYCRGLPRNAGDTHQCSYHHPNSSTHSLLPAHARACPGDRVYKVPLTWVRRLSFTSIVLHKGYKQVKALLLVVVEA